MTRDSGTDDTIPGSDPEPTTTPRVRRERATSQPMADYQLRDVIGRGGMGEVLLAHDRRLDREVAIKRMLTANPNEQELQRFLREAHIQARLDHPAIVPVHELGYDVEGRPFFTMKRLAGTTLHELIAAGAAQQRLLRAFVDVCLAVELAHSKQIVHRDLKPSNIVLGEYGEVYVLDWGVARVLGESSEPGRADLASLDGTTQAGALLGTPGYMAPEQAAGENVTAPADVYALGSILFEILTGEPLHPRGTALASTIEGKTDLPSHRRPDRTVPPELDSACGDALVHDPAARPSARALADRVQAYLDGDRDLERRRVLAAEHLAQARTAFAAGDRALATRAAGRALALDPESSAAAELVTRLVLEPPVEPPAALTEELRAASMSAVRYHARGTAFALLTFPVFLPVLAWNGIRDWVFVSGLCGLALVLSIGAFMIARRPSHNIREMSIYVIGAATVVACMERISGPFVMVPALACLAIMAAMFYPVFDRRQWFLVVVMLAAWLIPVGLEGIGVLAPTWRIVDGALITMSGAMHIGGLPSIVFFFGGTAITIIVAGVHAGVTSRAMLEAQKQIVTQAWHLRQLLPTPTR